MLLSILGNAAVLVAVIYRRIYRTFPVFSSYLFFLLLAVGVCYLINGCGIVQWAFLALSAVDSVFVFLVLIEVSTSMLKPFEESLPPGTIWFLAYMLVLAYASIWQFARTKDFVSTSAAYMISLALSSSGLQFAFFIALAVFRQLKGIRRSDRAWQIAAGLGGASLVSCFVTLIQLNSNTKSVELLRFYHSMDELSNLSWLCLLLYWTISFARPEQTTDRI